MRPVSSPSVEITHGLAGPGGLPMYTGQVNVNQVILWSVDRYSIRPVLKHGPRSLTYMQADQSWIGLKGALKEIDMMWIDDLLLIYRNISPWYIHFTVIFAEH